MTDLNHYLPAYPKIPHLPHNPNLGPDDIIASNDTAKILWQSKNIYVQEKLDGANLGVALIDGNPVLRNRDKFIRKGEKKTTASQSQFKPAWNWFYDNREKFEALEGYSVYGEWLLAQHGIHYDLLTDWFFVYDLLDQTTGMFIDPGLAMTKAQEAGFSTIDPIYNGEFYDYVDLVTMASSQSDYAAGQQREGVVVKVSDGKHVINLFKMVRADFVRGSLWNPEEIVKNTKVK